MIYSSYEALVQRAVRDHQRTKRVGGGHWIVTTQVPPPSGPLRETLRTSYGTWLRATAITGLASAFLIPPAAAATPAVSADPANAPGLPATNPQAIRPPHFEKPAVDLRPPELLEDLVQDESEGNLDRKLHDDPPPAAEQLQQGLGTLVQPPQKPPPARQPTSVETLTRSTSSLTDSKPTISPSPPLNRVDNQRPQPPGQHLSAPFVALEERVRAAESRPVTPERIDQWVTTVRTAKREAPEAAKPKPALITLAEVSPTPKMGWSYRVQPGDSLWHISTQLWTNNSSDHSLDRTWRVLHEWNRGVLGPNANLIHPGQVLEIPADAENVTTTLSQHLPDSRARDVVK
jgi:LysM repeat protein